MLKYSPIFQSWYKLFSQDMFLHFKKQVVKIFFAFFNNRAVIAAVSQVRQKTMAAQIVKLIVNFNRNINISVFDKRHNFIH